MGREQSFWEKLASGADIEPEAVPGQPIVELAGDRRVLIENHLGVMAYGRERILVKVRFGCVAVCGCGLELLRMTREQLVIRGRIDAVTVHRGGRA